VVVLLVARFGCVASAQASPSYPALFLIGSSTAFSGSNNIDFDFESLQIAGETRQVVIDTPKGFGVDLAMATGKAVGEASLWVNRTPGRPDIKLLGSLVVMAPSAYQASATAQACAPGTHTTAWEMRVSSATTGQYEVPIAIDRIPGGRYRLTMCFDDVHAKQLVVTTVNLFPAGVFVNPAVTGRYLFDAFVTPYGDSGSPSPSSEYELRGYEPIPTSLIATATYDPASHRLGVTGVLQLAGKAPPPTELQIYGGNTANFKKMKVIGTVTTQPDGRYSFQKRFAVAPKYTYSNDEATSWASCAGPSPAPRGCASYTEDGLTSLIASVQIKSA
jgi:hypothetical protein